MRAPRSLKQEFLKKWIMGLKVCDSAKQNMTILERKQAIKLSADIAIASTRNGMTCWSRAVMAKAYDNTVLLHRMSASDDQKLIMKKVPSMEQNAIFNKRVRSKKILKKSRSVKRVRKSSCVRQMVIAKNLAKKLVKKRTKVLKSLVPGGELMDDISLIEETLDYILSLRTQVDVMTTLAKASGLLNGK